MPGIYAGTYDTFGPVEKLDISGPTVFYLPGRGQKDSDPTALSKGVHFVEKIVSEVEPPPQVYTWSHADKYDKKFTGSIASLLHIAAVRYLPGYSSPAGKKLAQELIKPLVTDAEGKPLPYQQAQKNLRNLTLLSYCLGSTTAKELYNASLKMMYDAGYVRGQARLLLRKEVLISFANMIQRFRYTTVSLVNTNDAFVNITKYLMRPVTGTIKLPIKLVEEVLSDTNEKLKIQQLSSNSVLVTCAGRRSLFDTLFRRNSKEIISDVKLKRFKFDYGHAAGNYVNDAKYSQVAGIVRKALIAAVERQGPLSPLDLLAGPVPSTESPEETKQYNARLARAIYRGDRSALKSFFAKINFRSAKPKNALGSAATTVTFPPARSLTL